VDAALLIYGEYKIGDKTLREAVVLLQYLICHHKHQEAYEVHVGTNAWLMLAYPLYWIDKYCLHKWEMDKTATFSVDSLAQIVHEAWCAIYTFRLQEEIQCNSGLNAKSPFTPNRTIDSAKEFHELSPAGQVINKLYAYMYFLLLEEYAKNTYPGQQFPFLTDLTDNC